MATLDEAMQSDVSGYAPVEAEGRPAIAAPSTELQPSLNTMLRCPLPPIWNAQPDSLRQYYQGGQVPQTRLLSPLTVPNNTSTAASSTTATKTVLLGGTTGSVSGVSGTSSSSSTTTASGKIQQAVVTTPSLGPGQRFLGTLVTATCVQVLSAAASSPCRFTLYGTGLAQTNDAGRGLDVPPPAGIAQNLIADVVLDTSPYQWTFQNRVAANGDSPQQPALYLTVTNLDATSDVIVVTVQFVSLGN